MWLGPLSTPIAPPLAARRSISAPRSIAGQTSAGAPSARGDALRRAPPRSAPARGSAIRQPVATSARPSSIQLASGQSLSARERAVDEEQVGASIGRRRGAAAAGRMPAGRAAVVAERARRQLARAVEGVAVRLDADRMRHQPARRPFVARAVGAVGQAVARRRAPARATSADLVSPCRSSTAS